jgi:hypothetical protein
MELARQAESNTETTFEDRLSTELSELDDRAHKLWSFINEEGSKFEDLGESHKILLLAQLSAMRLYSQILRGRVRLLQLGE